MARKKIVPDDPGMEETPQLPEGEAPTEGTEEAVPVGGALNGEELPDSALPPDGGEGSAVPEEGTAPFEGDRDNGVTEEAPGDPPMEDPAADPQYENLLHEMESTVPLPPAEGGEPAPQDDPPL